MEHLMEAASLLTSIDCPPHADISVYLSGIIGPRLWVTYAVVWCCGPRTDQAWQSVTLSLQHWDGRGPLEVKWLSASQVGGLAGLWVPEKNTFLAMEQEDHIKQFKQNFTAQLWRSSWQEHQQHTTLSIYILNWVFAYMHTCILLPFLFI